MTKKVTIHKDKPINKGASPYGDDTMNVHVWGYYDRPGSKRGNSQYGVNIPNIVGITPLRNDEGSEQIRHIEVSGDKIALMIKGKEFWVMIGEQGHRYLSIDDPGYRSGNGIKVYHYTNRAGKWIKKLVSYK